MPFSVGNIASLICLECDKQVGVIRIMREKRVKQQRNHGSASKFPMTDSRGCVVLIDRSRIADRRLNNLVLEEIEVEEVHLKKVNL